MAGTPNGLDALEDVRYPSSSSQPFLLLDILFSYELAYRGRRARDHGRGVGRARLTHRVHPHAGQALGMLCIGPSVTSPCIRSTMTPVVC